MNAYRIATFLIRKLTAHYAIDYTPRDPDAVEYDARTWAKLPEPHYTFLISSGGKGYQITVKEVELAS